MKGLKGLVLVAILILSPEFASAQWEVVRGDWTVEDGVFTQTVADPQESYQTIMTTASYSDLNARFTFEVLNSPGRARMAACAMRADTPGIGEWGFEGYYLRAYCGWSSGDDHLELRRVSGGTDALLGTASISYLETGTPYNMAVGVQGNLIQGKVWAVGDVEPSWQVSANDGIFSTGRFGLVTWYAAARFSGVEITPQTPGAWIITQLTTDQDEDQQPDWSPLGDKVVFVSNRNGNYEIFTIGVSDGSEERITESTGQWDTEPCWSPDATNIVFQSNRLSVSDIYTTTTSSDSITRITAFTDCVNPDWSPDGDRIVYRHCSGGSCNLYSIPVIGGTPDTLTTDSEEESFPEYSPDGTRIVFQYLPGEEGSRDVYAMPASGGTYVPLATDPTDDGVAPSWSPNGNWIAFSSDRSGNRDIWIMDSRGESYGLWQITTHPAIDEWPSWSPDGDKLVFHSERSGNRDLWVVSGFAPDGHEVADSLFISSKTVCLMPDVMEVTLSVHNTDTLVAMTIPLLSATSCPGLTIDSVSFWGTLIESWEGKNVIIRPDTLILGLVADFGGGTPPLPPGEGPIAYIYFSIPCDTANVYDSCFIAWDTTTVQPEDQGLLFVDSQDNEFIPSFEPGTTFVALYRPGDVNGNCTINVGDIVSLISYLFKGGPEPRPLDAADVNGDCTIDIGDVVGMVNYLYKFGPPPLCGCASHPELAGNCGGCDGTYALRKTAGYAQVGLTEREVSERGKKFVDVDGSFGTSVAGIQLELSYDPLEIESIIPELTDRTQDMKLFFGAADGMVKIGIVDLTGEHVVPAGDGPLVRLRIQGSSCSSLKLNKGILVDGEATPLSVAILPKEDGEQAAPRHFILSQNHPNPFNPETEISFTLPEAAQVKLTVYNMLGQKVKTLVDEHQAAGRKTISWDGTDERGNRAASGIYFYRIKAGEFEDTKKMILMK